MYICRDRALTRHKKDALSSNAFEKDSWALRTLKLFNDDEFAPTSNVLDEGFGGCWFLVSKSLKRSDIKKCPTINDEKELNDIVQRCKCCLVSLEEVRGGRRSIWERSGRRRVPRPT